jgi:hypothetical protein
MREGQSHVLRAGSVLYSIHTNMQKYGSLAEEGNEVLARPWREHTAWMSIDMPRQRCEELSKQRVLASIYKVLLICAFMCWSENSLGVYFPAEGIAIPNFGGLAESIQWARRNGMDLRFLD